MGPGSPYCPTFPLATAGIPKHVPPKYTYADVTKQMTFKNKHRTDIQREGISVELGWPRTATTRSSRRD